MSMAGTTVYEWDSTVVVDGAIAHWRWNDDWHPCYGRCIARCQG